MTSIINGYEVPLKQEHIDFLLKSLLPLHTSYHLHIFYTNLTYCVGQYVLKDNTLIPVIVKELLKLWPVSCSMKEIIFINELGRLLEDATEDQFVGLSEPVFHRIGRCVRSDSFQVSEQAMMLWKSDRFVQLTTLHADKLFPIICPYLYETGTAHWNTAIKNLAVSVIRICMQNAPAVFNEFSKKMKSEEAKEIEKMLNKKGTWGMIMNTASSQDPAIPKPLARLEAAFAQKPSAKK
jgi:serine/threonine-protein phosphatase 2A regulatory subunit B'